MEKIEQAKKWLLSFGEKTEQNKDYLNELDIAIGDGDHGSNMNRGLQAVKEKIADQPYSDLSDLFRDIGMTFVSKVGGASGPLYGSAFISMAKEAKETDSFPDLLAAGLEGIQRRGKAEVGEKTMVDVWEPVCRAAADHALSSDLIRENLQQTEQLKATKGRASYLGERSIGHLDPGAQSSAYLFDSLLEADVLDEG